MSTTVMKEVMGVRGFLGDPLPQSPSTDQILEELEAEYQHITNRANNTGNSWLVNDYHLESVAGQQDYRLDIDVNQFHKPLSVTTIPEGSVITYESGKTGLTINAENAGRAEENILELTELEHMPAGYNWLKMSGGSAFGSNHSSELLAIYRKMSPSGEKIVVQIRPVPNTSGQNYRILYQVTDWWDSLFEADNSLAQKLPNSSQRMFIRALVAMNLLGKGVVKWALNSNYNMERAKLIAPGLKLRIDRYEGAFEEYLTSLDNPDITYSDNWADSVGL